jgi:hypothetical protein
VRQPIPVELAAAIRARQVSDRIFSRFGIEHKKRTSS